MVSLNDINPFSGIKLASMSTFATILLIIFISVLVIVGVGFIIYWYVVKRQFYIKIHLFKKIGNTMTRFAFYTAREVNIGYAGDKLWRVAPSGMWKFKIIKWLPTGIYQSAPNEYWYFLREDGEWINYRQKDIDRLSREANVEFVQEDMRLQRLATERLLEQRHMEKTFWEKWGNTIMTIILFLIISVCLVIIFYQFSTVVEKLSPLVESITKSLDIIRGTCPAFFNETTSGGGATGLVPVR